MRSIRYGGRDTPFTATDTAAFRSAYVSRRQGPFDHEATSTLVPHPSTPLLPRLFRQPGRLLPGLNARRQTPIRRGQVATIAAVTKHAQVAFPQPRGEEELSVHQPPRTFFRRERSAWAAAALYTLFLYSTLTVAFRIYVDVYDQVGRQTVSWWINAGLISIAVVGGALLCRIYRPRVAGYLVLILSGCALAFALHVLTVPAKRLHFFQYVPLTLLLFDALRFRRRSPDLYVYTFAAVCLIGLGDELLQGLLPNRYFGVTDLVVNATAGLLTLAVLGFVVREENYPYPSRKPTTQ